MLLAVAGMVFVTSCKKDKEQPDYAGLIIGKWKNDKSEEYKRYTTNAVTPPVEIYYDKEGFMWNEAEDVHEGDDGTKFYYYVDGNQIKEARPNMSTYIY